MGMAEYIEREAAYPLAKKICDAIDSEDFQRLNFGMRILDWIDDLPAADVRPVKRGRWTMNSDFPDRLICSECGAQFDVWHWEAKQMHFCPNCGACMEES